MTRDEMAEMQKKLGAAILGWNGELTGSESPQTVQRLRQEIQDTMAGLTKAFLCETASDEAKQPQAVDGIETIACNLAEATRLYLTFHAPGGLEQVTLLLSEDAADLTLMIDGQRFDVDFFLDFRNGANDLPEPIRAAHKECALCHEEAWGGYRFCEPDVPLCDIGAALCAALRNVLVNGVRPLGAYRGQGACADSFRVDASVEFRIQADTSQ